MTKFALVQGGVVENIIVADEDFARTLRAQYERVEALEPWEATGLSVSPGWRWHPVLGPKPPVDSGPDVPQVLTRAQAIGALILAGLDEAVDAAIDAIEDPTQRKLVRNDWTNRLTFERDNPTLLALAKGLGLSSLQLDNLFIQGKAL